jgi:hypothetical protein
VRWGGLRGLGGCWRQGSEAGFGHGPWRMNGMGLGRIGSTRVDHEILAMSGSVDSF